MSLEMRRVFPDMSLCNHNWRRLLTAGVVVAHTSVVGAASAAPSPSQSDSGTTSTERTDGDARTHRLMLGARLGVDIGLNQAGFLTEFDGGYRVTPEVVVGAALQTPISSGRLDGDACADAGVACIQGFVAMGPRVELQPWADAIIGPWVGGQIGVLLLHDYNAKSTVGYAAADVGVEVRPITGLGIGAYVGLSRTLTSPYVSNPSGYRDDSGIGSAGLRLAGRF